MDTKHFRFEELVSGANHASRQLRMLYEAAASIDSPMIVELGTSTGRSTTCFLTACEERGGHIVSIDIADCSDVSESSLVTFVQADAADVNAAIAAAPTLKEGIDILYVDALHTPARVRTEVEAWFPYLKQGGLAFFDDVDATPYRRGARKDSWGAEADVEGILHYLRDLFNANETGLEFSVTFGSTGLACLRKVMGRDEPLAPARPVPVRPLHLLARAAWKRARA